MSLTGHRTLLPREMLVFFSKHSFPQSSEGRVWSLIKWRCVVGTHILMVAKFILRAEKKD